MMKSFFSAIAVSLFSFSVSAAGPFTLPNLEGVKISDEEIAQTFETFYKGDTRLPASTKSANRAPSNVLEGFEYKVKLGKTLSAFWVIKRGDQYELIFSNTSGSRASFTIPVEHFLQLNSVARDVRAPASDIRTCKENYARIEIYDVGKKKVLGTCLNMKKTEGMKQLGAYLSSYLR
ncbi:MAG TPA: hypothetical protein VM432_10090 [Bdellovibrionales bacterium]|nr:hypothetical protein [Bdellovibrionales bacterium]